MDSNIHKSPSFEASFWNEKWMNNQTGWDIGYASTPIVEFMKGYADKNASILIPGCGNAHEAVFLLEEGFTNITLLDISEAKVSELQNRFRGASAIKVVQGDFYEYEGKHDLIIEQTFFCANPVASRKSYVQQIAHLLTPKGKLIGVLFYVDFGFSHPPFGGSLEEYKILFQDQFSIIKLEKCYNSIPPRAGTELFVHFQRK